MLIGMLDAARGCMKEELRMDTISNNLANCNVIGFKKDKISFQDLLKNLQPKDYNKVQSLSKEALVRVETDLQQGDMNATGNSLDFGIEGDGFFKVDTPLGLRYTRKGNFVLDGQGYLITQEGYRVLGSSGPIQINEGNVYVDGAGKVMVNEVESGQIALVSFSDPKKLEKAGLAFFKNLNPNNNPETAVAADVRLKQGYVELSNVDVVQETVDMIECMRAYESYTKAMQALDGIDNKVINEVGRLR